MLHRPDVDCVPIMASRLGRAPPTFPLLSVVGSAYALLSLASCDAFVFTGACGRFHVLIYLSSFHPDGCAAAFLGLMRPGACAFLAGLLGVDSSLGAVPVPNGVMPASLGRCGNARVDQSAPESASIPSAHGGELGPTGPDLCASPVHPPPAGRRAETNEEMMPMSACWAHSAAPVWKLFPGAAEWLLKARGSPRRCTAKGRCDVMFFVSSRATPRPRPTHSRRIRPHHKQVSNTAQLNEVLGRSNHEAEFFKRLGPRDRAWALTTISAGAPEPVQR